MVSDWNRLTEQVDSMCNPNLLINPDFSNPVNQRGQNEYTGYGYTIDMWRFMSAINTTLTVNDDGITITCNGNEVFEFFQPIEHLKYGELYTVSVEMSDGTIKKMSVVINEKMDSAEIVLAENCYVDIYNVNADTPVGVRIFGNMNGSVSIKSIKLELGPVSTLKNEIVNYAEELRKCQRYYYRMLPGRVASSMVFSTTGLTSVLTMPEEMRIAPTITDKNLHAVTTHGAIPATSTIITGVNKRFVTLDILTAIEMPRGESAQLEIWPYGYIEFSAEL